MALEQWCSHAGIGCTDADSTGNGGCYTIDGDGCLDALGLHSGTIDNDGEGHMSRTGRRLFEAVFVDEFPTWCNIHNEVAAFLDVEAVADGLQQIAVAGE